MNKASYDEIGEVFDELCAERFDLQSDLVKLANKNSPLDMRYLREFFEELRVQYDAMTEREFNARGWTYSEFLDELDRRLQSQRSQKD